jgi:Tol biopolymer transport system component
MKKMSILLVAAAFLFLGWATVSQQNARDLFQKALSKERAEGDLKGAIALYQEALDSAKEQSLAAQAQLRIGMCYEKLGNMEAVKAYEAVLSRFPKEAEAVAEARSRLAALRKEEPTGLTMARLLPPEVDLDCPTLSPDGTKIAGIDFSKGQNAAFYDLATRKTGLITNYDWSKESRWTHVPIWSPDGREVSYYVGAGGAKASELWISDLAGKSRLLFKNPHGAVVPCDWLPGGSMVAAIQENIDGTFSMGLVSVKGGNLFELYRMKRKFNDPGDRALKAMSSSADASPDGRLIAFSDGPTDRGRDIFIIPAKGGSPIILTDHPADDKEPRWSPDGRHIVFLSNRHGSWALWGNAVRDGKPDGAPILIMEGMQDADLASWTKNGLITQTTALIRDVYTLEIDPQNHKALGKPRALDFTPSEVWYSSSWSPDGKYLSLLSFSQTGPTLESFTVLLPLKGGKARKFKNTPFLDSQAANFQWLPDGSAIGFVFIDEEKGLHFVRLESNTGEWKTRPIPAGGLSKLDSNIAWTGDGKSFYYRKGSENGSEPAIIVHDLETGQERCIFRTGPNQPLPGGLKISRDYKRLAMGSRGEIVLVDTETGHAERLECGKKQMLSMPAWSPDGKFLVAVGNSDPKEFANELFIVSLADGQMKSLDISQHLSRGSQVYKPDWSPDGRKIVFNTWMNKIEVNLIQNLIPKK